MSLPKHLIKLTLILMLSTSCSTLVDIAEIIAPDSTPASGKITETKDNMTGEVKYTSQQIAELYQNHKPVISLQANNQYFVTGGIKISPYLIKSKSALSYFFQISVTEPLGLASDELMIKCGEQEYVTHKFSEQEKQARDVTQLSLDTNDKKKFYYQEEVIHVKVPVEYFNYLKDCTDGVLMRAKGVKLSLDSSLLKYSVEMDTIHRGMLELEAKATEAMVK